MKSDDLKALREVARARCEDVAVALLSEPTNVNSHEMRWGQHGSLVLATVGDRRGCWYDFSAGRGGDMIELVASVENCSIGQAMVLLRRLLNTPDLPSRSAPHISRVYPSEVTRTAAAVKLFRASRKAEGTAAERYFQHRKLVVPSDVSSILRFHPACVFGGERRACPAIVLPFTNIENGQITAIHKIAIYQTGLPVRRPDSSKIKLSMGIVRGAAIMLRPLPAIAIRHDLLVCEGFETALGVIMGGWRRPIFAVSGASFIANLRPIEGVRRLVIAADNDRTETSLKAALACAEHWNIAGCRVEIICPSEPGADFADVPGEFSL